MMSLGMKLSFLISLWDNFSNIDSAPTQHRLNIDSTKKGLLSLTHYRLGEYT